MRRLLGQHYIEHIEHVPEDAFEGYITYPAITTIQKDAPSATVVTLRSGKTYETSLPATGESWAARLRGGESSRVETGGVLSDAMVRISAGVATGRDRLFVMDKRQVPEDIDLKWVRPTVGGRELGGVDLTSPPNRFVCPYADNGQLYPENELGAYGRWAAQHREELESRFCVSKNGKPWYSWHENPPMTDILRPKILFKDVASEPKFWVDDEGDIVPRHSVYYGVPKRGVDLFQLADYLNSKPARMWMEKHCQRAANGYIRLQSRVLKKMPIPTALQVEGQVSMAL